MESRKNILNRIKEGEGLFQEFKTSLDKVDRTMAAFANAKGGSIFIGVDDQGNIHPFRLTNRLRAQIEDIAKNTDPPIKIHVTDLGNLTIIAVKEGEDKPYKCSDGFFLRIGATNQKLSRDEMLDLAVKVNRLRFEAFQVTEFRYPQDFSNEAFSRFVSVSNLESVEKAMGRESFLISLGVAEKQRGHLIFNNAGILFFAKNPQDFIPQAKLNYTRYQGTTKTNVVDRMIFSGPLLNQLEGVYRKMQFDVPVGYKLAAEETRKETPQYPPRALEEAIVNALMHRDYHEEGAEIMVDYYSDRIEITNPGELMGKLDIANLGSKAIRRNLLIAELFYRCGKGEKLGSGIPRMRSLMNEWKLLPPVFEAVGSFFSVTFIGPKAALPEEKLLLLPKRPRSFMEERNMLKEEFTTADYASRFDVTQRTAQKDLQLLINAGLVLKSGLGKGTVYKFV